LSLISVYLRLIGATVGRDVWCETLNDPRRLGSPMYWTTAVPGPGASGG
jgi:hypothetical protein